MTKEIWKDIPSYEGYYQVSNNGRLRSLDRLIHDAGGRTRLRRGVIFNPKPDRRGRIRVALSRGGRQKYKFVHCLVMLAFVGSRPDGCDIHHKNDNPSDNRLENLVYLTHKEHAQTRNYDKPKGERHPMSKLTREQVEAIRERYNEGMLTQRGVALEFGISQPTVSNIVTGYTWENV